MDVSQNERRKQDKLTGPTSSNTRSHKKRIVTGDEKGCQHPNIKQRKKWTASENTPKPKVQQELHYEEKWTANGGLLKKKRSIRNTISPNVTAWTKQSSEKEAIPWTSRSCFVTYLTQNSCFGTPTFSTKVYKIYPD